MSNLEAMIRSVLTNGLDSVNPKEFAAAMAAANSAPKLNGNRKERFSFHDNKTFNADQLNGLLEACRAVYNAAEHDASLRRHANKMYAILMSKDA